MLPCVKLGKTDCVKLGADNPKWLQTLLIFFLGTSQGSVFSSCIPPIFNWIIDTFAHSFQFCVTLPIMVIVIFFSPKEA